MKAVITSFGSSGDIEPMLALALELRKGGHHPVVAFSPNFKERVNGLGLPFVPVGAELDASRIKAIGSAMLQTTSRGDHTRHFLEAVLPSVPEMFRQLLEICRNTDVLISTPFQLAARMAHETLAVPFVTVHLSHFATLGGKEVRDVSAPMVNAVRAQEGLGPLGDPLGTDGFSSQLALFAIGEFLVRRNARWPTHHHVTGFFFLDAEGFQPDPALEAFLSDGPPPVSIGFGSMVHEDPEAVTRAVLGAVEEVGCRAILQKGWTGLGTGQLPLNVRTIGFTPHSWLFPRVGCVVHHGGAGTTAAAFRAGVPAVVVPHTLEQPIWAEFARGHGCTGAVIPFDVLNSKALAEGIRIALTSNAVRKSAAEVARKLSTDQGVERARKLIEQLVDSGRRSTH